MGRTSIPQKVTRSSAVKDPFLETSIAVNRNMRASSRTVCLSSTRGNAPTYSGRARVRLRVRVRVRVRVRARVRAKVRARARARIRARVRVRVRVRVRIRVRIWVRVGVRVRVRVSR